MEEIPLVSSRDLSADFVIDAPGRRAPQTLLFFSSTPNFFIVLIEYPLFRCLSCWVSMACFVNFEFPSALHSLSSNGGQFEIEDLEPISFRSCFYITVLSVHPQDIAAYIKKEFDKKYNPTWHCIVGRNFGSYVTHETRHFIYFYLGQVAILLFKSG